MHTAALPISLGHTELPLHDALLWTMARGQYLVRCDLRRLHRTWEVRVFIDDQMLLSRQCPTQAAAGALSGDWRRCLTASGWSPLGDSSNVDPQAPAIALRPALDRRRSD